MPITYQISHLFSSSDSMPDFLSRIHAEHVEFILNRSANSDLVASFRRGECSEISSSVTVRKIFFRYQIKFLVQKIFHEMSRWWFCFTKITIILFYGHKKHMINSTCVLEWREWVTGTRSPGSSNGWAARAAFPASISRVIRLRSQWNESPPLLPLFSDLPALSHFPTLSHLGNW